MSDRLFADFCLAWTCVVFPSLCWVIGYQMGRHGARVLVRRMTLWLRLRGGDTS